MKKLIITLMVALAIGTVSFAETVKIEEPVPVQRVYKKQKIIKVMLNEFSTKSQIPDGWHAVAFDHYLNGAAVHLLILIEEN